jgi:hypothetical protein
MQAELQDLIQGEVTAYQSLLANGYQPPVWILPDPSCALLRKIGSYLGPDSRAFEFGSGLSTVVLREVCAAVTSIEDTAEWLDKTEHLPGITPKRAGDKTRAVPLTRCFLGIVPYHSFNLDPRIELLQRLETADLIVIDNPPNPATREHTLITALEHAKPGALILIDDLDVRAAMRFSQRLARDNAKILDFVSIPIDHVLGLFQKKSLGDITYRPTLREMVGAWLRR